MEHKTRVCTSLSSKWASEWLECLDTLFSLHLHRLCDQRAFKFLKGSAFRETAIKTSHLPTNYWTTRPISQDRARSDRQPMINECEANLALKVYLWGLYWLKWNIGPITSLDTCLINFESFSGAFIFTNWKLKENNSEQGKKRRKMWNFVTNETQNHFIFFIHLKR